MTMPEIAAPKSPASTTATSMRWERRDWIRTGGLAAVIAAMHILAFGVLIVFLVITGSVWIIANLNSNMMPMTVQ